MLDILIMAGFESYVIYDHERVLKLLAKFPGSIMFINIDDKLPERDWEYYIKKIQEDPKTAGSRLGILSYNTDQKLMQKYLMDIAVPCGYIQLKLGIKESTRIMLIALEANEARGRRKYIRAFCREDSLATVNFKGSTGTIFNGKILDISAVGMAAMFERLEPIPANSVVRETQLKLHGSLVLTNMVFIGKREDNAVIFLFDAKMNPDKKVTIHHFIKYTIQHYMDNLKV